MSMEPRTPSPMVIAFAGLTAIAVAMGIGRFAFTPILPIMQSDAGLSVTDGAWLASANYLGFLLGAMSAVNLRIHPESAIRGGLVVITLTTLWMGIEDRFGPWILLRAAAGGANAWAQIFAFAWCLEKLATTRRPVLNGMVFAGVGTGIAVAGGSCLVLMQFGASSAQAWIGLGLTSLIATAAIWRVFGGNNRAASGQPRSPTGHHHEWNSESARLVICFGVSGFGYIIPGTFLPAMARQLVADPFIFGWSWPIFGAAAALAPLATARLTRSIGNRGLWMLSHLVMAVGVVLPLIWSSIHGIIVAGLLVGGSFMVNALASMQEARVIAGSRATSLMAAMTAAFAVGQIIGPVAVRCFVGVDGRFDAALLVAAAALILSAGALAVRFPRHP